MELWKTDEVTFSKCFLTLTHPLPELTHWDSMPKDARET